jgi:hypothetical protein
MQAEERQFAIEQLTLSEARLLQLVDGLSPSQWDFREVPERWSIAENVEHLVLFEDFIRGAIRSAADRPAELQKKTDAAKKESVVLALSNARAITFKARDVVLPTGRWQDKKKLVLEFCKTRARTLLFASETQLSLRDHFFPHIAFGDLDCYQWLIVLGQHTLRHMVQIEEIQKNNAYPAS